MIKIGRRGSLTGRLTVHGIQGHIAYPHLADNPDPSPGCAMLAALTATPLDDGTAHFQPSTLQVTTIDVGNPATNVIPAEARGGVQHPLQRQAHRPEPGSEWLRRELDCGRRAATICAVHARGEAFLTPPGPLSQRLVAAPSRRSPA